MNFFILCVSFLFLFPFSETACGQRSSPSSTSAISSSFSTNFVPSYARVYSYFIIGFSRDIHHTFEGYLGIATFQQFYKKKVKSVILGYVNLKNTGTSKNLNFAKFEVFPGCNCNRQFFSPFDRSIDNFNGFRGTRCYLRYPIFRDI